MRALLLDRQLRCLLVRCAPFLCALLPCALLPCALLLSTSAAHAAPPPASIEAPRAPAGAATEARNLYEAGRAAFMAGDFAGARRHFEMAHALDEAPVLLFNMARCSEELGDADGAVDAYYAYLEAEPAAPDRREVERRIRAIRRLVGQARAEHRPDPGEGAAFPWHGALVAVGAGAAIGSAAFFLTAAEADDEASRATLPENRSDAEARADDHRLAGWITGGVAVAALGAGIWIWAARDTAVVATPVALHGGGGLALTLSLPR